MPCSLPAPSLPSRCQRVFGGLNPQWDSWQLDSRPFDMNRRAMSWRQEVNRGPELPSVVNPLGWMPRPHSAQPPSEPRGDGPRHSSRAISPSHPPGSGHQSSLSKSGQPIPPNIPGSMITRHRTPTGKKKTVLFTGFLEMPQMRAHTRTFPFFCLTEKEKGPQHSSQSISMEKVAALCPRKSV